MDIGADEFHGHLYCTEETTNGGPVNLTILDVPGTSPVLFWIGTGILYEPLSIKNYGLWYLEFPILSEVFVGSILPGGWYFTLTLHK